MRSKIICGGVLICLLGSVAWAQDNILNRQDVRKGMQQIISQTKLTNHEACFGVSESSIIFASGGSDRACMLQNPDMFIAIVHTHPRELSEEPSPKDREIGKRTPVYTIAIQTGRVFLSDKGGTRIAGFVGGTK